MAFTAPQLQVLNDSGLFEGPVPETIEELALAVEPWKRTKDQIAAYSKEVVEAQEEVRRNKAKTAEILDRAAAAESEWARALSARKAQIQMQTEREALLNTALKECREELELSKKKTGGGGKKRSKKQRRKKSKRRKKTKHRRKSKRR